MATEKTCRVRVALTYLSGGGTLTPYKWKAKCSCGWTSLSWSWSRVEEMRSSRDPEQWVKDNGHPYGGALVNALEHVGLYEDTGTYWV